MKQFHHVALKVPPLAVARFPLWFCHRICKLPMPQRRRETELGMRERSPSAVLELSSELALQSCGACKLRAFERHFESPVFE
jgi:hypothetical protein